MPPTDHRRRGRAPRRTDDAPDGLCRACKAAPALPGEDTCRPCGEAAIERARVGVDAWLRMHADRVLKLERDERERTTPLRVVSEPVEPTT